MAEMNEKTVSDAGTAQGKKSKKTLVIAVVCALAAVALICGGIFFYLNTHRFTPTFEVNGKEFDIKATIRDLEALGLTLCQPDGAIVDSGSMKMNSGSKMVNYYYVGVKNGNHAELTGFKVRIANTGEDAATYTDCHIREIVYTPETQSGAVAVKICGIDFSKADRNSIKELVKKAEIPFSDVKLDDFLNAKSSTVDGSKGKVGFNLTQTGENISLGFTRKDIERQLGN